MIQLSYSSSPPGIKKMFYLSQIDFKGLTQTVTEYISQPFSVIFVLAFSEEKWSVDSYKYSTALYFISLSSQGDWWWNTEIMQLLFKVIKIPFPWLFTFGQNFLICPEFYCCYRSLQTTFCFFGKIQKGTEQHNLAVHPRNKLKLGLGVGG